MTQIKGLRGQEKENQSVKSASSFKSAILTSDAVKLGDMCELISGQHIEADNYNTDSIGTPYLTGPSDFGLLHPIITRWTEYPKVLAKKNDILITVKGSGTGKLNILDNELTCISRQLMAIRVKSNVNNLYLYYYLDNIYAHFQNESEGSAIPGIGREDILKIPIPLPPITIQKEIADYLQFRLTCVEEAKQAVKAELEAAKSLKQAYLREVFSSEQSKDWGKVKLGDMCENLDSKRVPITSNVRNKGNIPYYGASGVVDYVEDYIFDEDLLLVSEDGANLISRTQPIAFSISGKTWINNHAHVLKFESRITQQFVEFYINYADINIFVSGSAQPKLNQENLNKIPIPLPPLAVQKEIADYLQTKFTTVDTLVQALTEKKKAIDDLPQAFLREVFGNTDGAG